MEHDWPCSAAGPHKQLQHSNDLCARAYTKNMTTKDNLEANGREGSGVEILDLEQQQWKLETFCTGLMWHLVTKEDQPSNPILILYPRFPTPFSLPDPARRPPSFLTVPSERERGTDYPSQTCQLCLTFMYYIQLLSFSTEWLIEETWSEKQ